MRSKSRDPKSDLVVGPGQYDVPEDKMPNMTFGRKYNQRIEATVGPG